MDRPSHIYLDDVDRSIEEERQLRQDMINACMPKNLFTGVPLRVGVEFEMREHKDGPLTLWRVTSVDPETLGGTITKVTPSSPTGSQL